MSEWTKIAKTSEVTEGEGKCVEIGNRQIALFKVGDQFYAIDNICAHQGGPLAKGSIENGVVMCPWHGWEFDVRTGESPSMPRASVSCFPIKVEGDDILVVKGKGFTLPT